MNTFHQKVTEQLSHQWKLAHFTIFPLGLALALSGCGITDLSRWRYDNRDVRAAQESSLPRFGDHPIEGMGIKQFFKDKVGLITIKGNPIPMGRAAPISSDGYYLTAWHVVAERGFMLSDRIQLKPYPKKGGFSSADYFRVDEYPGRVVWHDRSADLAVVKFKFNPPAVLKSSGPPLENGTAVFSGASGLNSGTLLIPQKRDGSVELGDGSGNGPFQTAGRITGVRKINHGCMSYESTLISRGGMSGAPVVDGDGRLVGIIAALQPQLFARPATRFSMIEPMALEALISEDRKRQ